jgi:hypothetical protein
VNVTYFASIKPVKNVIGKTIRKSCNMRTDGNEAKFNNLHCQYILIKNVVQNDVEEGIGPTCNAIPENFYRDKSQTREIKTVNNPDYKNPAFM